MVKENWILDAAWKNRQAAKKAAIRGSGSKKMMLIPHPDIPKTWIEVPESEIIENENDKYGFNKIAADWETTEEILAEVSEYCKMPVNEICKKTRKRDNLEPRQVAHYLAKQRTNESLAMVGWKAGRKDHATVLNSIRVVENLMQTDRQFYEKWAGLILS